MDAELLNHCKELLAPLGAVRTRRMFGGHGIYVDDLFMALIAYDQLYLKADDETRPRFEAAGCEPFRYAKQGGESISLSYFRPPEEAMESPALMQPWARLAFGAALRARAKVSVKRPKAAAKTAKKKPGSASRKAG
ncbi:TfoX/Sxy family protein [Paucibacter sp. R3-3]|uniref:TfoX/Sxy family protein n=1 Tax=Roseateles agri TaxID=3098619 RepID=A0ABU5DBQ9_9BURK|nr:TfoX/Sxy family protein [Paucibacter sp. R3-3]MDY0743559.1 TfoX/Sxy family protein [Paucibacter sp. R3-3]